MDSRVTIYDIAKETNFSAVTVHRALNNKGRISPKTKQLILDTAKRLGYKANPAAQGLRRQPIKIGAILFCPVEEYVDEIIEGIAASGEELEKYNVSVDIKKIEYTNNINCLEATCEHIKAYSENNYNGIILFASSFIDEMNELCALIKEVSKKGILFATVANNIPVEEKVIHVGINAFMAGNMAAEMLEFSCKGKDVALLVSSNDSPINQTYIDGFMSYDNGNVFSNISIYEHYDNKEKVMEITKQMLCERPCLSGIYMTTASSALACKCIKDMNKSELSVITTDLLQDTPELLQNKIANATIFQNPYKQGKNVVRFLYNYITAKTDSGIHLLTPHIILSSNVSSYLF